jgi:hypothetical protein
VVLLIDEIDRADDEFEAFLLEVLSTNAVTVPELGTIRAAEAPIVVLTSNRTRELHDALKRRCLYHWIDHPPIEREMEIVRTRQPDVGERLAAQVVNLVHRLRADPATIKPPGVAETLDWVRALGLLPRGGARFRGKIGTRLSNFSCCVHNSVWSRADLLPLSCQPVLWEDCSAFQPLRRSRRLIQWHSQQPSQPSQALQPNC